MSLPSAINCFGKYLILFVFFVYFVVKDVLVFRVVSGFSFYREASSHAVHSIFLLVRPSIR